ILDGEAVAVDEDALLALVLVLEGEDGLLQPRPAERDVVRPHRQLLGELEAAFAELDRVARAEPVVQDAQHLLLGLGAGVDLVNGRFAGGLLGVGRGGAHHQGEQDQESAVEQHAFLLQEIGDGGRPALRRAGGRPSGTRPQTVLNLCYQSICSPHGGKVRDSRDVPSGEAGQRAGLAGGDRLMGSFTYSLLATAAGLAAAVALLLWAREAPAAPGAPPARAGAGRWLVWAGASLLTAGGLYGAGWAWHKSATALAAQAALSRHLQEPLSLLFMYVIGEKNPLAEQPDRTALRLHFR